MEFLKLRRKDKYGNDKKDLSQMKHFGKKGNSRQRFQAQVDESADIESVLKYLNQTGSKGSTKGKSSGRSSARSIKAKRRSRGSSGRRSNR